MKKLILSIAIAMALATLQSFQLPANPQPANPQPANPQPVTSNPATVTYLGVKNNGVVFELKLENENSRNAQFSIRDKTGEVVYEENFREKNLVKRFILPCEESGEYTFVIRSGSMKYEKHFQVSRKQVTTIDVNEVK